MTKDQIREYADATKLLGDLEQVFTAGPINDYLDSLELGAAKRTGLFSDVSAAKEEAALTVKGPGN